jgi:hypothetical protein
MPRKTTKTIEPVASFPAWKARVLAGLDKITAATVRERDLRQLYINGKSPEEAARRMDVLAYNTLRPHARLKRR